jgi:hypothetical protein
MPPDQMKRYPADKGTKAWPGIHGFQPEWFLNDIDNLQHDIRRLRALLFGDQEKSSSSQRRLNCYCRLANSDIQAGVINTHRLGAPVGSLAKAGGASLNITTCDSQRMGHGCTGRILGERYWP